METLQFAGRYNAGVSVIPPPRPPSETEAGPLTPAPATPAPATPAAAVAPAEALRGEEWRLGRETSPPWIAQKDVARTQEVARARVFFFLAAALSVVVLLLLPVLGGSADPVVGQDGRPTVTGALGAAGARTSTVVWQGWGHPTFAHSGCAQQSLADYLKDATLPADGTACPA